MNKKQIKKTQPITENSVRDTKVYAVLRQLSVYDVNRLKKFVASPYFNRNEDLSAFLNLLDQDLRRNDGGPLGRELIWTELYGNQLFNDLKFRKLCSDLLRLTEEFLAQEIFTQNSLQQADNLLVAVYNRKLEALYNSSLSTSQRLSQQYHFRPASFYYYEYSFERNFYQISGLELDRTKEANIEKISANLDKFYVAEKLRSYITMIDRQRMVTHNYDLLFMDEIIELLKSGALLDVVPINLYYQVYLTHKDPSNPENFRILKNLIRDQIKLLPQIEAFEILDSALNHCISRVNSGDKSYLREYMELSLMGVKEDILLVNGALSPWTFRNIVFAGLRLGDFVWVRNFIEENKEKIELQYRDNAVSFNLANLYLYEKKYDELLRTLSKVEYEDPSYNLNSKIMLILTYYELDEIDSLSSLLSSFEIYLRRKKEIPTERRHHYMQLIQFVRALIKIPEAETGKLAALRKKVAATEGVVNKDWLLEKIDQLLGDYKEAVVEISPGIRKTAKPK